MCRNVRIKYEIRAQSDGWCTVEGVQSYLKCQDGEMRGNKTTVCSVGVVIY